MFHDTTRVDDRHQLAAYCGRAPLRRRAAVAKVWTDNRCLTDPPLAGLGYEAIVAHVGCGARTVLGAHLPALVGLTASGVTRSLLPLEKLGLVSRQPDSRDARAGYATLTDSKRQLLDYAVISVRTIAQDLPNGFQETKSKQCPLARETFWDEFAE